MKLLGRVLLAVEVVGETWRNEREAKRNDELEKLLNKRLNKRLNSKELDTVLSRLRSSQKLLPSPPPPPSFLILSILSLYASLSTSALSGRLRGERPKSFKSDANIVSKRRGGFWEEVEELLYDSG